MGKFPMPEIMFGLAHMLGLKIKDNISMSLMVGFSAIVRSYSRTEKLLITSKNQKIKKDLYT
jgi:hypothetical protein